MQFNKLELVLAVMTERQAFCWRAYLGLGIERGLSLRETGALMGISYQAVQKHLKAGQKSAKKQLFFDNIPGIFEKQGVSL